MQESTSREAQDVVFSWRLYTRDRTRVLHLGDPPVYDGGVRSRVALIWASMDPPQKVTFEDRGTSSPLAFTPQVDPKQEVILV